MVPPQPLPNFFGIISSQNVGALSFQFADKVGNGMLGMEVHNQVHMTVFSVELNELRIHLFACLLKDPLQGGKERITEHAPPVLCHKD